jgi:hypothetical protein
MYFPYLRGKQFELEALLGVPAPVYHNTLPIVEPVNSSSDRFYLKLAQQGRRFILIMNPQHPQSGRLAMNVVQTRLVNGPLLGHPDLTLGFIIDQQSTLADLQTFLTANPTKAKAVIVRYNPIPATLTAIDTVLRAHSTAYLIFDEKATSTRTRAAFSWHTSQVLITDGFQRQARNSDYPSFSYFDSNVSTWSADGWAGIGDYLSVGDHFQEGGSQPLVVTLHLTIPAASGLEMHHFSSTINATVKGAVGPKFLQAGSLLVNSPRVLALPSSTGLLQYQDWDARSHLPRLGAAKQASLQHHIETLSRLV